MARNPRQPKATFSDGSPIKNTKHDIDIVNAARLETEKVASRDLKEQRIDHIMQLMRKVCDNKGNPTWTPSVGKFLAKTWGIPYLECRRLSAEASKRVRAEVRDPEAIQRDTGAAWHYGLRKAWSQNRLSDLAKFVALGATLGDGPTQVEVKVEIKQPTPMDGAAAVAEMFGDRVKKSEPNSEPDDGSSSGTPEE